MYKWLVRAVAVAMIGLIVAYKALDVAGVPPAEQRRVRVALMAVVCLSVAICIGRFLIRPKDSPAPGRSEADYQAPPPDTH
jgi:hypothetical protein